ncbi:MAG: cyclase family protein [Candidatus Velthaea sp.]
MPPLRLPEYDDLPPAAGGARSGWGLFGAGDNAGLLNLLTPERVAAAATLVRRGAVFALNAPLDAVEPAMFARGVPRHRSIVTGAGRGLDDVIDNFYPQASSQWDALGHMSFDYTHFYNGATRDEVMHGGRNTIDHWARRGIAGRAVLLDLERTLAAADDAYSPGDPRAFSVDDLERARRRSGVDYRAGDILLLHTGFLRWYGAQDAAVRARLAPRETLRAAGIEHSESMARYLWNSHVCAIASDNPAVEVWPADGSASAWPFGFMHHVLIGQLGFALGELWWLNDVAADCAADGVYEMFLTAAPWNLRGAVGSPANALAIK